MRCMQSEQGYDNAVAESHVMNCESPYTALVTAKFRTLGHLEKNTCFGE